MPIIAIYCYGLLLNHKRVLSALIVNNELLLNALATATAAAYTACNTAGKDKYIDHDNQSNLPALWFAEIMGTAITTSALLIKVALYKGASVVI